VVITALASPINNCSRVIASCFENRGRAGRIGAHNGSVSARRPVSTTPGYKGWPGI